MPHLVLDFSEDLASTHDIPALLNAIHNTARDTGLFTPSAIKSRAKPYPFYRIGEMNGEAKFLHLTVFLLKGRTDKEKYQFSQLMCRTLSELIDIPGSISVDVRDLDEEVYSKRLP